MILEPLGTASVLLALGMSVYGVFAGVIGTWRRDANLVASARLSAVAVALALTVAMALLELALLTDDFGVGYVANTSSTASPTWVKVVTLWAALDGSILEPYKATPKTAKPATPWAKCSTTWATWKGRQLRSRAF